MNVTMRLGILGAPGLSPKERQIRTRCTVRTQGPPPPLGAHGSPWTWDLRETPRPFKDFSKNVAYRYLKNRKGETMNFHQNWSGMQVSNFTQGFETTIIVGMRFVIDFAIHQPPSTYQKHQNPMFLYFGISNFWLWILTLEFSSFVRLGASPLLNIRFSIHHTQKSYPDCADSIVTRT